MGENQGFGQRLPRRAKICRYPISKKTRNRISTYFRAPRNDDKGITPNGFCFGIFPNVPANKGIALIPDLGLKFVGQNFWFFQ